MIVMQTTRLENVGAFCGVCGGVARAAVYLFLIFFWCSSWTTILPQSLMEHPLLPSPFLPLEAFFSLKQGHSVRNFIKTRQPIPHSH
ncbi:CXXC finger 4, isoform CRA_a, partial [Mus musculus]